jgi:hypothetical protein
MQMFMQHLQNNPPAGGLPPVHVRDKRGEFLKGRPPVFSHAADPLEADDWVRAVEKKCYMHLASYREQLRLGGSHIKLHVLTMLLLSLGMNLLQILELAIFQKV